MRAEDSKDMVMDSSRVKSDGGFTLVEMTVVVFLIAIVAAIAMPQLLPVIAFSEIEGEARHLANWGRAAMAHATLMREEITVYIDLDQQLYYATYMKYPDQNTAEGENQDQMAMLNEFKKSSGMDSSQISGILSGRGIDPALQAQLPKGFDIAKAQQQQADEFDRYCRKSLEARAKNVHQDQSFLDEIGPLFDKEFTLEGESQEPVEETLDDPVVEKTKVNDGLRITEVSVGGEVSSGGVIEIQMSPLGLTSYVGFHVSNEDGDTYTVYWDPVTGGANVVEGSLDI